MERMLPRLFDWSARASAPRPLTVLPSGRVMVLPSTATVSPAGLTAEGDDLVMASARLGLAAGKLPVTPTAREPTPPTAAH